MTNIETKQKNSKIKRMIFGLLHIDILMSILSLAIIGCLIYNGLYKHIWIVLFIICLYFAIRIEDFVAAPYLPRKFRSCILLILTFIGIVTFLFEQNEIFSLLGMSTSGAEQTEKYRIYTGLVTILLSAIPAFILWHWRNVDKQRTMAQEDLKIKQIWEAHEHNSEDRLWENFIKFQRIASAHNGETASEQATGVNALESFYIPESHAEFPKICHIFIRDYLNNFYEQNKKEIGKSELLNFPANIKAAVNLLEARIKTHKMVKYSVKFGYEDLFLPKFEFPLNEMINWRFDRSFLLGAIFKPIKEDKDSAINLQIEQTSFAGSDLSNSIFTDVKVTGCDFSQTDFSNAELSGKFTQCIFKGSLFYFPELEGNNLNFSKCNFEDSLIISGTFLTKVEKDCTFVNTMTVIFPPEFVKAFKEYACSHRKYEDFPFNYMDDINMGLKEGKCPRNLYEEYKKSCDNHKDYPWPELFVYWEKKLPYLRHLIQAAYIFQNSEDSNSKKTIEEVLNSVGMKLT